MVLLSLVTTILNENVQAEGTMAGTRTLEETARAVFSSGVLTHILEDALYNGRRSDDCTGPCGVRTGSVYAGKPQDELTAGGKAVQCIDALMKTLTTAWVRP
jgi:hypothetical protein